MLCPRCQRTVNEKWAHCPYDGEKLRVSPSVAAAAFRHKSTKMAGTVIGDRFQIKGFVNKGATSRVYLAEDIESHEQVIVKLFSPEDTTGKHTHARFHQEAQLLMGLDHPNIIKVIGFGESQGRPYVVTEPLRGESLHDYLKREHAMPTALALLMMRDAARGLMAAHAASIVHHDVKPGNLFLLGPIGRPHGLKVIDFGMAKDEASRGISAHDLVLGTIEYMAPEQIVSDPIDARTDVYGLGVVMFRVFTGHLPFDVDTNLEMLAHQMFSPAPPPSWLNDQIVPNVEQVILRAMCKRPDNRYATMGALISDLERILGSSLAEVEAAAEPYDDAYEPQTPFGRDAAEALRRRFGAR